MCGKPDQPDLFLFCDSCNAGWHTFCCTPPLASVPEGVFVCERCQAAGITERQVEEQQVVREGLLRQGALPDLFPLAQQRRRDERAADLHGRLVVSGEGFQQVWGRVVFRGAWHRPYYFMVKYGGGRAADVVTHRKLTGVSYKLQGAAVQPPRGVYVPEAGPLPVR